MVFSSENHYDSEKDNRYFQGINQSMDMFEQIHKDG